MSLADALANGVLLGDGANGTLLADRGYKKQPYDLANLEAPELVRAAHREYFDAGSDFVETNTFCSNHFKLEGFGVSVHDLNLAGAVLARSVCPEGKFVLGAMGPCGKPLAPFGQISQEAAFASFVEAAQGLVAGGVDGFFLETFVDIEEIAIAVKAVRSVSDLPILVSKAFIEDGEMLAEGLPGRRAGEMSDLGVTALGANCIVGPQRMLDLVRMMAEETDLPIIAFPTPGLPQLVKGEITYDTSPEYFAKATMRLIEEGARVVGGCCGTSPDHIRAMRKMIDQGVKPKVRTIMTRSAKEKEDLPQAEPSQLSQKIGQKFVIAVEMDVPRGLRIQKLLDGAKTLRDMGCDVINISDGARARLRMNPAAVSNLIQTQSGIEVTMHFSCRDRNLLAVQSDLLGAHALGIRNILSVTGDPANIGDYPSATSVFDIDAIGLCRIMSRFNEGLDLAGYSVGMRCAFTICCAYNPGAMDQELEDDRLKRKVEAGAQIVYTQPVFDLGAAERTAEVCRSLGVPLLLGVLPLRSARHTEFMHNEVPGVTIPEDLRAMMANAPDDATALAIGIEQAQKLSAEIKKLSQGIYLMPPFGNAGIAASVMEAVK
ncbi:MAG: bifunctional homocysteine S-methyltransferase/methylenetetrahydrofolate reductase [Armatimonadetes bacterium]|nr:bifunctional homocysteine S-methyltransferase/methylenetetrahydrofolate reductase [Armatimonadota bacterium]